MTAQPPRILTIFEGAIDLREAVAEKHIAERTKMRHQKISSAAYDAKFSVWDNIDIDNALGK